MSFLKKKTLQKCQEQIIGLLFYRRSHYKNNISWIGSIFDKNYHNMSSNKKQCLTENSENTHCENGAEKGDGD